jgi:hypothetical protein
MIKVESSDRFELIRLLLETVNPISLSLFSDPFSMSSKLEL